MGFFSKIKNVFFRKKVLRLSETTDSGKAIKLALKEKDQDKIIEILDNSGYLLTSNEIVTIVKKLPLNKRVEALKIARDYINSYDLVDFINNKLDGVNKVIALGEFQDKFNLYDMYSLFNNLPPDRRTAALDVCIDRFDSFSLGEVIEFYIPLAERGDVLEKYEKLIGSLAKVEVISRMIPDEGVKALAKYANEITANNIYYIITSLPSTHVSEALRVSYEHLSQSQIRSLIMYNVPEHERLNLLEIVSDKLDMSTKSDIIKYGIPEEDIENALTSLSGSLDQDHVSNIIENLKVSAKVLKVLSSMFGAQEDDVR